MQLRGQPHLAGAFRKPIAFKWPKTALQSRASHSLTRKASPTLSCIKQLPRLPIVPAACRLSPMPSRFMSTAFEPPPDDDDDAHWEARFLQATQTIPPSSASHAESAAAMRELVRSGLLLHTDLRDRPERFFHAHRLLARHAVQHGPGFWIRFTVHYNLCFGTVLAVGGPEQASPLHPGLLPHKDTKLVGMRPQPLSASETGLRPPLASPSVASYCKEQTQHPLVATLHEAQEQGLLGCFALTEKLAGVQSGLLVQTAAEYDTASGEFVLHTPSEGAAKNWISQGFTADKAVVLADLRVDGVRRGPHAFLIDLRRHGELVAGVSVGDMGTKTTGNDLDNAWIAFDRVRVPRTALLNGYAYVDEAGTYSLRTTSIKPFEMIGQRLYTGRVAVAQAALAYRRELFRVTKEYADAKPIWSPTAGAPTCQTAGQAHLSSIPQLRALFAEADDTAADLERFVSICESRLTPLLRSGAVPDEELAHAIATAKVKAVEASIDLCWRLKQEVGSYALMGSSGFAHLDFLNCCKFAEGDSRVLMLKMARDRMRRYASETKSGEKAVAGEEREFELCGALGKALSSAKGDKAVQARLWDANWRTVYALAEAVMERTIDKALH